MNLTRGTVSDHRGTIRGDAVYHQLHRDFAARAQTSAFDMPARRSESWRPTNSFGLRTRIGFEPCGDGSFDIDQSRSIKSYIRIAAGASINSELQKMATAIAVIEPSLLEIVQPGGVTGFVNGAMIEPDIATSSAGPHLGHARKVRLANHGQAKPTIEHVVPTIQFIYRRHFAARQEIERAMCNINHRLMRSIRFERWNLVIRQSGGINVQTIAAMSVSHHRALSFRPFQYRKIPGWPVFDRLRPRIILVGQT